LSSAQIQGTRQRFLFFFAKIVCQEPPKALIFAESQGWGSRQRNSKKNLCREPNSWLSAKNDGVVEPSPYRQFCREPWFAEGRALGIFVLCREPATNSSLTVGFAEGWLSAKKIVVERPIFAPRQSTRPSAKMPSPVVIAQSHGLSLFYHE
jgi:hypothetical protein